MNRKISLIILLLISCGFSAYLDFHISVYNNNTATLDYIKLTTGQIGNTELSGKVLEDPYAVLISDNNSNLIFMNGYDLGFYMEVFLNESPYIRNEHIDTVWIEESIPYEPSMSMIALKHYGNTWLSCKFSPNQDESYSHDIAANCNEHSGDGSQFAIAAIGIAIILACFLVYYHMRNH